jgi:hypothetical protein
MQKYFLVLATLIVLFSCSQENKEQKNTQLKITKKGEYVKPKNINYDSTSHTYKVTASFDSIDFNMGYLQPGSRSHICVDRTKLMKDSLLREPFGNYLGFGDTVKIEHYINTEYMHGNWSEPIYKVKVIQQGKEYDGYLPQNVIAIAVKKLSDKNILMLRLANFVTDENNTGFYAEAIVADTSFNVIFCKNKYKLIGGEPSEGVEWHYYYTVTTKKLPASGFDGAVDLININMDYPACGYMGGDMVLVWDGTQLYYAYQAYNGSDAGNYGMTSYPILPGDKNGKKNNLLSVTNTISYEVSEKDVYTELEHDSLVMQYIWQQNKGIVKSDTLYSGKK